MTSFFGSSVNIIFSALFIVIWTGICIKVFSSAYSKEKSVPASIVSKNLYRPPVYRKSQAPFEKCEYVITFLIGGTKKDFKTDKVSFDGYDIGQKGILTYKGSKIINFE